MYRSQVWSHRGGQTGVSDASRAAVSPHGGVASGCVGRQAHRSVHRLAHGARGGLIQTAQRGVYTVYSPSFGQRTSVEEDSGCCPAGAWRLLASGASPRLALAAVYRDTGIPRTDATPPSRRIRAVPAQSQPQCHQSAVPSAHAHLGLALPDKLPARPPGTHAWGYALAPPNPSILPISGPPWRKRALKSRRTCPACPTWSSDRVPGERIRTRSGRTRISYIVYCILRPPRRTFQLANENDADWRAIIPAGLGCRTTTTPLLYWGGGGGRDNVPGHPPHVGFVYWRKERDAAEGKGVQLRLPSPYCTRVASVHTHCPQISQPCSNTWNV
ncbi:hypothetical protein SCP_1403530 [Sparassis crispa]|uniref:Uncharacterized protein n=1 Tax=Sparassis crispa TaxID=139825 RepID=A0A401H3C9_9APHY|nr:hypothetical protein SCP_1403530 [Sparassis crispa]GBE88945.1 hypothetical protein SCP_1403530 [Sparassis crispa]